MTQIKKKPDWVPSSGGEGFATSILQGVEGGDQGTDLTLQPSSNTKKVKTKNLTLDQYVEGVLAGDRMILARTITLIESNAGHHLEKAQQVLRQILPYSGKAIRIGITGVPGAGKSTFIDTFGCMLCERGHRVAVLAVDPSSSVNRGSIMGDKTRMERLALEPECFIRPSPSGGTLGGVNRKTRETMLACEAAGFDVILVETVGVGQSEAIVSTMVDFFLLLTLTGAGDELQNFKKGVIEMADAILINKADGENKIPAARAMQEFNQALHYLKGIKEGWDTKAYCCSALTGEGIDSIWEVILRFEQHMKKSGDFFSRRKKQSLSWFHEMVVARVQKRFYEHPSLSELLPLLEKQVSAGTIPVTKAVDQLFETIKI